MRAASPLPAMVLTQSHRLVGLLDTAGRRMQEVLNDSTTEYLRLTQVAVAGLTDDRSAAALPSLVISKPEIIVCTTIQEWHEAAERRLTSYVQKRSWDAFVVAGPISCRGTINLRGTPDAVAAIKGEFEGFFPVTNAELRCGSATLAVKIALINREKVAALHIGAESLSAANSPVYAESALE